MNCQARFEMERMARHRDRTWRTPPLRESDVNSDSRLGVAMLGDKTE